MKEIVFVTGADRGLGYALTEKYLEMGSFVAAGKFFSHSPSLDSLKKRIQIALKS